MDFITIAFWGWYLHDRAAHRTLMGYYLGFGRFGFFEFFQSFL